MPKPRQTECTWVWDVPFSRVTRGGAMAEIERMIGERQPRFVITANLHYVMLSARDARLQANNQRLSGRHGGGQIR
jgi:UDP-N-acetyl-D-mannosaminuronic acid transferase (WecB/TagA/CpsF family)